MIRLIRRLLAFLLVMLGLAVVLASGFALFWSDELQQLYVPSLPNSDYSAGLKKGETTVEKGRPIGTLEIPRLGLSSVVLEGDDTAALLFGVGHLSDTPLPWHGGNSVFAAHRDTFFRPLAGIRRNDIIRFSTADAEFEYVVKEIKVVESTDLAVLNATPSATLTLITCFPFDYVGPAPNRFIVKAERRLPPAPEPAA
ncbi:MAG TPA: class D sortase [Vicinamibacterales bacterium]|nr:class D sortase [Vicinamibacterales bacterium]